MSLINKSAKDAADDSLAAHRGDNGSGNKGEKGLPASASTSHIILAKCKAAELEKEELLEKVKRLEQENAGLK